MLKRIGLIAATLGLVCAMATPAAAQDKAKSLMAGVSFIVPGSLGTGFFGALDIPTTKKLGKAEMSILVGGFYVKLDGWYLFGGGGGLKFEVPMNEKMRAFAMILAMVGRDDIESSFGFTPGGGILYNIGTDLDFFAAVGLGSIRYAGGGDNHLGAHITFGVNKKLGK